VKTVYSAPNISLVSIFQSILKGSGIRCWLKNHYLSAGLGDLPPIECWPQLCKRYGIAVVKPEEATPADLLIVAVKHHHLDQAIVDMKSAIGAHTIIVIRD
jgi:hypothetical protein